MTIEELLKEENSQQKRSIDKTKGGNEINCNERTTIEKACIDAMDGKYSSRDRGYKVS